MARTIDAVLISFGFPKEAIDMLFEWFDIRCQRGFSKRDTKMKIRKKEGPPLWHFAFSNGSGTISLEIGRDIDCEPGEYWVPPRHIELSEIKRFCIEGLKGVSFCKEDSRVLFHGGERTTRCHVRGGEVSVIRGNTIGLGKEEG